MATRTRLPRQATRTTTYTFDESDGSAEGAGSGDESSEEEYGRKRAKPSKRNAKPRKRIKGDDSDEDGAEFAPRSVALVVQLDEKEEPEMVEYEVKRVDFGKMLPLETLRQIFTYLHPSTLYQLSNLSSTWRTIVKSDFMKPLWLDLLRGPAEPDPEDKNKKHVFIGYEDHKPIPTIDGEEIEPFRLATLLFNITCEALPPRNICYARSQRSWVLVGDLRDASEMLELLQLEDDAQSSSKYVETSLSAKSVQKTLGRANRLKRGWSTARMERGKALEAELTEKYSPRVKEFVLERLAMKEEHAKLGDWVSLRWSSLIGMQDAIKAEGTVVDSRVQNARVTAIRNHLTNEGIFPSTTFEYAPWFSHPLVNRAEPLTDEIWNAIRPVLLRVIARYIALTIIARCGSRTKASEDDDDSDDEAALKRDLLKRPKSVSAEGWKWVRPILAELLKHAKQPERPVTPQPQGPILTIQQREVKNAFFRECYDKALDMLPSQEGRFYAPRFGEFLVCPTVQQLYDDAELAVDNSTYDDDLATWAEHLDAIFDEMGDYVVEVRLSALKAILAATTEMSAEEIEELDADALADPAYNDSFFTRASSWVNCADCEKFGSLIEVLQHRHESHPLPSSYAGGVKLTADAPRPQVELSLEVACAWSAILELANSDADKPGFKGKHLTKALGQQGLGWENGPWGTKRRRTWTELIEMVCVNARMAHRQQEVLAVPVIALKKPYKPRRARGWWW
ncbi:F-box domain, cyclin-like domain containing protein [Rhodotorula toruloides]|uniref:F-box domain, cyclin-like domain containing protein n=1 Tax=Rhodotorula toruloides TaxID=5286 RepID=A0A511KQ00_RHOTO|nr:F-box domain, cyclin-like domain containing protein [Rhodotorula toruloides]